MTAMLDVRYEGEVSKLGLETFLNAHRDDDHWLLIFDLDGGLLRSRRSESDRRSYKSGRCLAVD